MQTYVNIKSYQEKVKELSSILHEVATMVDRECIGDILIFPFDGTWSEMYEREIYGL